MTRDGWVCVTVAASLAIAFVLFSIFETERTRGALPPQIETVGFANVGRDDLLAALLPLVAPIRAETCGAALHNLSGRTKALVQKDGADFFKTAQLARRATFYGSKYSYPKWVETGPMARIGDNDGPVSKALYCMGLNASLGRRILQALRQPGSFYADGSRTMMLVVVPELDLVAFTWDDAPHQPPPCSRMEEICPWR